MFSIIMKRTRRRNYKKNNKTKRRKKTKRIKRKMRGGSAEFRAKGWAESRRRNRKALNLNPDAAGAERVEQVSLNEAETTDNPLFMNILSKFFREVDGWFGKSYELDPTKLGPNNKINVISAHGLSIPDTFFVVPKGLTLYLPVAAGDVLESLFPNTGGWNPFREDPNKLNYIREYKEGSLIQDTLFHFYPFYRRTSRSFDVCGLIELDVPHLSVNNATEANKFFTGFISRQKKRTSDDVEADRKDKEESGDIQAHLKTYEDVYFGNNIDGIIDKNDLILSATKQKQYYLSGILRLIAEARKKNPSISGVWFGTFCRSGELIDINKFRDCNEQELPELPEDFFKDYFHYEGISDELVRQASLASNASTINFKNILDALYSRREHYESDFWRQRIGRIRQVVEHEHEHERRRTLSLKDVCFVFQMKQKYL